MAQSTVQRINDTSSTKLFFVSINNYQIQTNYIMDFQLNYSTDVENHPYSAGFILNGFVVINDIIDEIYV